jgi:tetratricopeptide (TPR) repeat protein
MHLLDSDNPLESFVPSIANALRKIIYESGAKGLLKKYQTLKEKNPETYSIDEQALNTMGYYYMQQKNLDAALGVFKINIMEFPSSFNPYDSYGEALMENGQKEEAIENYKKSLELNPGNTNGIEMLAKMGVIMDSPQYVIDSLLLDKYVGIFELAPGFNIEFTRDGNRFFGQATGQGQFELFAKSDTEFYLKVVEARVKFEISPDGVVTMTLYQNGQVLPGKKK